MSLLVILYNVVLITYYEISEGRARIHVGVQGVQIPPEKSLSYRVS